MNGVLAWVALLAALMLGGGCSSTPCTPWVRGEIVDGMPRHDEKFAHDAAFFVPKVRGEVKKALEDELRARGFVVVEKEEDCDFTLKVEVKSWEFNDAGFAGMGGHRFDGELSISCIDRRRRFIVARWGMSVRSDLRIFREFALRL